MPFEDRLPSMTFNRDGSHIKVGVTFKSDPTKKAVPHLSIAVREFVAKLMGWTSDTRIMLVEGTGPDLGMIGLRAHQAGFKVKSPNAPDSVYLRLHQDHLRHHKLPANRVVPEDALYEIKGDLLLILLPEAVVHSPAAAGASIQRHRTRMTTLKELEQFIS